MNIYMNMNFLLNTTWISTSVILNAIKHEYNYIYNDTLKFYVVFYKRIELIKVAYFSKTSRRTKFPNIDSFGCWVISHLESFCSRNVGITDS
jgi:hypothetical protein